MASIGPSVGKLRIDMLHPLGEMFSKNHHICSRIADTSKCRAEKFPIVSVTEKTAMLIVSQFITSRLRNVLEQNMFMSKLCDTLKSMPKSVDSVFVTFSLDAR